MNEATIVQRITELKKHNSNITWSEIQETLEQEFSTRWNSPLALRAWWRRRKDRLGSCTPNDVVVPPALPTSFDRPLTLEAKTTLVIADIHVPYHDQGLIDSILRRHGDEIEQIVIAGDLFDFSQISRHPRDTHQPKIETELTLAGKLLAVLASFAPVYVCQGNHDERFALKLDTPVPLRRLVYAAIGDSFLHHKIVVTDYDFVRIGDNYIVGHLSQISRKAGAIAAQIADTRKRHVLAGHDHIRGVVVSKLGWVGASIGCVADYKKFWYSERRLSTFREMQQGYAIIYNDHEFSVFDPAGVVCFKRYVSDGFVYHSWRYDE